MQMTFQLKLTYIQCARCSVAFRAILSTTWLRVVAVFRATLSTTGLSRWSPQRQPWPRHTAPRSSRGPPLFRPPSMPRTGCPRSGTAAPPPPSPAASQAQSGRRVSNREPGPHRRGSQSALHFIIKSTFSIENHHFSMENHQFLYKIAPSKRSTSIIFTHARLRQNHDQNQSNCVQ